MAMIPCSECGRHHQVTDESCPFCGATEAPQARTTSPFVRKAFHLVGGAVTTVVLAACYGTGGFEDLDGDGYDGFEDCDDNNADINPGADEICDDSVDNDCDGDVDDADADCSTE